MKVVRICPNEKYSDFDVIAVYDNDFCTRHSNWKAKGAPEMFDGDRLVTVKDNVDVQAGDSYDGHDFHREITLARAKANKLAEIADERWVNETAGIKFKDYRIDTTERSQNLLSGVVSRAKIEPSFTTVWKTKDGYLPLTNAEIVELGLAVSDHIQACFANEQPLVVRVISAATIEEVNNVQYAHIAG